MNIQIFILSHQICVYIMSAKKMKVDERAEEMDLSTQSAPNAVRVSHADITMDVDFGTTTIQGIYIMFLFIRKY